jgi:NDP-sugar pyrophosphorylase family protein
MRQAVVLAGGLGTRIAALSGGRPKVLLPVGGKPFIAHLLGWLTAEGVEEVVLLLGHKADEVLAAALQARGDIPGAPAIRQSVETSPLGTGGALRLAEPLLDPTFLMVNGDTFLDLDLTSFERLHDAAVPDGVVATLALVRHREAGEKGAVVVGPEGQIARFVEKGTPGPGLINAGVYLIERSALGDIPSGKEVSLEREVFPLWMARADGRGLQGVIIDAYFVDIGLPEDYLQVRDGLPGGNH